MYVSRVRTALAGDRDREVRSKARQMTRSHFCAIISIPSPKHPACPTALGTSSSSKDISWEHKSSKRFLTTVASCVCNSSVITTPLARFVTRLNSQLGGSLWFPNCGGLSSEARPGAIRPGCHDRESFSGHDIVKRCADEMQGSAGFRHISRGHASSRAQRSSPVSWQGSERRTSRDPHLSIFRP
jgi:hypothetical protein